MTEIFLPFADHFGRRASTALAGGITAASIAAAGVIGIGIYEYITWKRGRLGDSAEKEKRLMTDLEDELDWMLEDRLSPRMYGEVIRFGAQIDDAVSQHKVEDYNKRIFGGDYPGNLFEMVEEACENLSNHQLAAFGRVPAFKRTARLNGYDITYNLHSLLDAEEFEPIKYQLIEDEDTSFESIDVTTTKKGKKLMYIYVGEDGTPGGKKVHYIMQEVPSAADLAFYSESPPKPEFGTLPNDPKAICKAIIDVIT